MGHIILKPSPDEDFYLYWSTVVDMAMDWGTRAELMAEWPDELLDAADRWERADSNGSSSRLGRDHSFDTNYVLYGQYGTILVKDLKKMTDKFHELAGPDAVDCSSVREDHPEILALLTPFEDD